MEKQEKYEAGGVEVEQMSKEDYLRSMAEMCIRICKNTSGDETIERIVILFGSIERNAVKVERARVVGRLNGLITEYIRSPRVELSDTLTAKVALEEAIAIARGEEEGG